MRQDNIQISSYLMRLLAFPPTYRSSRIVRKRIIRSLSASILANILTHLVLELELRLEEYSVLRKRLQVAFNLRAFGERRQNLSCIGMTDGLLEVQLSLESLLSQCSVFFGHLVLVLWLCIHRVFLGCASFGPVVRCSRRVSLWLWEPSSQGR